jgi:hypothetical protein
LRNFAIKLEGEGGGKFNKLCDSVINDTKNHREHLMEYYSVLSFVALMPTFSPEIKETSERLKKDINKLLEEQ